MRAGKRFTVDAVFNAVDRFTMPISRMMNRVSGFTRKMSRGFHGLDQGINRLISGARTLTFIFGGLAAAGTAAFADVNRTGMDFEYYLTGSLLKMDSAYTRTSKQFSEMRKFVRDIGRETEFTPSLIAREALYELAGAGLKKDEAQQLLPHVLDTATANMLSLKDATQKTVMVMKALRLPSETADEFEESFRRTSNLMTAAANESMLTYETLFEALKQGAAPGVTQQVSPEYIVGLAATLAQGGVVGSRSATALRNIYTRLAGMSKTDQAGKLMSRVLKVNHLDPVTGEMRDFLTVIEEMQEALGKLSGPQRTTVLNKIFGMRAIVAADLMTAKVEDYHRMIENIGRRAEEDVVRLNALQMRLTGRVTWDKFLSALHDVKLGIYQLTETRFKSVLQTMTAWINDNNAEIVERIGNGILWVYENFEKIVDVTAKIFKTLAVLAALAVAIKSLTVAVAIFNAVAMLGPWGLITLAIAALAAGIAITVIWWDELVAKWADLPLWAKALSALFIGPLALLLELRTQWDAMEAKFDKLVSMARLLQRIQAAAVTGGLSELWSGGSDRAAPQVQTGAGSSDVTSSEVTIRDESGRAEVTKGELGPNLQMMRSGAFNVLYP